MEAAYVPTHLSDKSLEALTAGQQETLDRIAALETIIRGFLSDCDNEECERCQAARSALRD